ncbi:hypothetical protein GFS24_11335 [Chitinophaga sp. SYP-B3965]|uniref:hypothetical protein n=1 Tax=Chitinophaga sp. SYP-B3965 TaxID=2663120 RepID=UPI001299C1A7|nr:hypothetical protein [Chitinophaga sp. SYP-B3965]MRG45712.1 hypothetical protein [Chitinophaga sp. SYP-B3965]
MKLKNPISGRQILLPGVAIMLIALLLFACNKNNETPGNDNMTAAAKAVTGKLVQGEVKSISDAEGLLLHINDLDIIVSQMPGSSLSALPGISSAAVITSAYGLILKDLVRGNVYFLVNNDEESIRRFNAITLLFPSTVRNDVIFGTTIIRSSNG